MGGAIVQMMALKYPELMKGIILVGTGARLRVNASILNGIRNHFEEIIPKLVSFAYYQGAPKELIERGAEILRKCKPEVLFRDFLACDRFDIMNEVRNINLPTLIICGLEDKLTPVKYATYLHQMIKGSRLQIISKAGHMVMMEAPRIFNEKLKEFILSQKMIS
jgi:pimeloyl-ACP methyl ester carboxylesterase